MKLLDILPVTLVLRFANQLVDSKRICLKNQYIVKNGNESKCLDCNSCPDGTGLSPPCGSIVNHPPPIDCIPCVAGKTYSDEYGPSSCKNCHLCSAKEIVIRNCTVSDDTICSKTCKEGYYHENSTYNCQPCSYCCNKDNDIRIKECQSMPLNEQCSVHSTQQCKPQPASTVHTVATAYSNSTGTLTASVSSQKLTSGAIISIVFGTVIGVLIIVFMLHMIYKRRKKTKRKNKPRRNEGDLEDGAQNHLLVDHDNICDNHMEWNIVNKSPNQITEGQTISLSLSCDNHYGDVKEDNRKCSVGFEWKKDGDNIPKNNHQNYSKDLTIDDVEVADSGQYYCEIYCNKHQHIENSSATEIQVQPGEGNELKLLSDLDLDIEQNVINLLTPKTKGIGNWMDLGSHYGMKTDVLKALGEDKATAAAEVLAYIKSDKPELTVFAFCKVLKSDKMKQNKIVKLLKNELTKPKETAAKSGINAVDRPDSGISEEYDSDGPQQLNLPSDDSPVRAGASSKPSLQLKPSFNLSYAASGESSVEDLVGKLANVKPVETKGYSKVSKKRRKKSGDSQKGSEENNDTSDEDQKSDPGKKPVYGRQRSKDSQKSADNDDVGTRERKRSRSSSITNSIKEMVRRQSSIEHSALLPHCENSDGGLQLDESKE